MEIVDVVKCFVLKFSVKLEKATSITARLVSQDHLSSFCSTDVQVNDKISTLYIFSANEITALKVQLVCCPLIG